LLDPDAISMPFWLLPETTFAAPAAVPPTVFAEAPAISTPWPSPTAAVPVTFVPTKLPSTTLPVAPVPRWTPQRAA
jgi:hypothetical protein